MSVLISIILFLTLIVCSVFSESCFESDSGRIENCKEELVTIKPITQLKRISEKKCEDYANSINRTIIYKNFNGDLRTEVNYCARKHHDLNFVEHPNDGELFRNGDFGREFPHMALIGYGEGKLEDYKCGGSLISEQWIVSAAHCSTVMILGDAKHIKLGVNRRLEIEPNTKVFSIVQNIPHPYYTLLNVEHDIVLFKMNEPATLNLFMLPICLPQSNDYPTISAITTGWGKTHFASEMSDQLKMVILDYFPIETCQNFFENEDEFIDTNFSNIICAGSKTEIKDTCHGDSGSPLQYYNYNNYCMYTISGIVSHGSSYCGNSAGGAIYTNVFKYLDWIESIVWPAE